MKNKFSEKIIILSWIIFLFICLGLLSFTSHAESYFPMGQNDNNNIPDFVIEYCETNFDSENNNIIIQGPDIVGSYTIFHVVYWVKSDTFNCYGELNSNGYQWSLYKIGSFTTNYKEVKYRSNNPSASSIVVNQEFSNTYWLNRSSSLYNTSVSYVSNVRIYTSNTEGATVVLKYGSENPIVDLGTAILPGPLFDPVYTSGDTPPAAVPPTYTINNYTWTTNDPPAFDNSSVENALESLGDIITYQIGWLSSNLHGEFVSLTENIKGLFEYIGKTLQYYGNAIISSINNSIQNFYDNMANLVQPIFDKINYLTQPIDGTVIYDNISSTSLVSNITTINSSLTSFQTSFNNVTEPSSFKIPIHLENLPVEYFGIQEVQYIDLGVLGSTEKGLIRTFMWALITYGLFITIVDSISNYINGGGDES